jgi:hypothetical protein
VPQQHSAAVMDPQTAAGWNGWARAHVAIALAEHDKLMTEAVAQFVSEYVAKRLKDEVAKLSAEVGQLRADQEILRSIVAGKTVEIGRKDVA